MGSQFESAPWFLAVIKCADVRSGKIGSEYLKDSLSCYVNTTGNVFAHPNFEEKCQGGAQFSLMKDLAWNLLYSASEKK